MLPDPDSESAPGKGELTPTSANDNNSLTRNFSSQIGTHPSHCANDRMRSLRQIVDLNYWPLLSRRATETGVGEQRVAVVVESGRASPTDWLKFQAWPRSGVRRSTFGVWSLAFGR